MNIPNLPQKFSRGARRSRGRVRRIRSLGENRRGRPLPFRRLHRGAPRAGESGENRGRERLKKRAEPGGIASLLFTVGRSLRLSVREMLEMPLSQMFQFAHCALLEAGCDTAWVRRTPAEQARFDAACAFLRKEKR